jgi:hypothetical protein
MEPTKIRPKTDTDYFHKFDLSPATLSIIVLALVHYQQTLKEASMEAFTTAFSNSILNGQPMSQPTDLDCMVSVMLDIISDVTEGLNEYVEDDPNRAEQSAALADQALLDAFAVKFPNRDLPTADSIRAAYRKIFS